MRGYHGSVGSQAQIVPFSRQDGMPGIQGHVIRLILLDTQEKPMVQWRSLTRRAMEMSGPTSSIFSRMRGIPLCGESYAKLDCRNFPRSICHAETSRPLVVSFKAKRVRRTKDAVEPPRDCVKRFLRLHHYLSVLPVNGHAFPSETQGECSPWFVKAIPPGNPRPEGENKCQMQMSFFPMEQLER